MNAPVPAPSILDSVGVDPARAQEILADALQGADDGELFVERSESESFLQRVFQGATGDLVKHFCAQADLTTEQIEELEQLLKSKKPRR